MRTEKWIYVYRTKTRIYTIKCFHTNLHRTGIIKRWRKI